MTHRNRILAALNHREPDRVPVDLSGHRSSGIAAMLYPKLRSALGLPEAPVRVYDPVQQLAIVHEDMLDLLGIDTIELGRGFALEDAHWADWTLPDGTPCQMPIWALPERDGCRWILRSPSGRVIAQMPDDVWYFEQTYWPFAEGDEDLEHLPEFMGESMWTHIASPPGPLVAGLEGQQRLREGAKVLRGKTDRAIIGLFGGNLLEMGTFLYRNDLFLMMLAAEPERTHRFLDAVVEMHLANLDPFLDAVGDQIDIILFGDDLGMQQGPQISPAMYDEFFKPRHRLMWTRVKNKCPHLKIMLHCCGGVRELLPGLIDAGLDAINPVQTSCRGMEPQSLKREFGSDMVFWGGGCDTQQVLPLGTPAEVADHVRAQVEALSPGGGFVFQQVHNIVANVPTENIMAMYRTLGRL
ncbi:MAG: methylcobalamin:coenzyme M methyltransferase [Candidatus Hydrogenedentes bacterium ADurb.Bin101]|nr:MAG: methylcobalamin:coenzyme M methyltransferase [Candidatus Hydrogenedentes bacterium ADurb.Bin101]HOC69164.1 uroporphyrinogen decarboxylase family protein [Candidatus Hydrogenedentota bacterium]